MVVGRSFLVAGGNAPALLQAIDQPLHAVALAVGGAVEPRRPPLVHLAWDDVAAAASAQILAHPPAAVALVADQAVGAEAWSAPPDPLDGAAVRQGRQGHLVVPFAPGQDEDDRLALPLGPHVDFGAEATPAATERFCCRVPPFAPAAC